MALLGRDIRNQCKYLFVVTQVYISIRESRKICYHIIIEE